MLEAALENRMQEGAQPTYSGRSEGFPARDIWFLHTVSQGPYQMGRVVGSPPPSPPPSVGVTRGLSPSGPPTLLDQQGTSPSPNGLGAQAFQSHGPNGLEVHRFQSFSISRFTGHARMLGPSVFPDSQSYQNAWSFSISRFTGHTRMLGPLMFKA